jgi:hypothetical protein
MSDATGSRVPNGWGDPSTERHLQVPPRHATPGRVREILTAIVELAEKGLEWEEASLAYYERIKDLAEEALDA